MWISYMVTLISKLKEGSVVNLYVNIANAGIIEQETQRSHCDSFPFYSIFNVLFFQI